MKENKSIIEYALSNVYLKILPLSKDIYKKQTLLKYPLDHIITLSKSYDLFWIDIVQLWILNGYCSLIKLENIIIKENYNNNNLFLYILLNREKKENNKIIKNSLIF